MKVLVTGGGGFLGSYIVRDFIQHNYEVTNLSRNHYVDLDEIGVKTIKCDISDVESVRGIDLKGFDAIIHTAAKAGVWGDYEEYYKINFVGTKNLIDKAIADGVKYFIYTSSPSVVFGKEDILSGDEKLVYPKKYYTFYAENKAKAEAYVLSKEISNQINTISLRPHLIWGPGDPHLFPRIIQKARSGRLKQVGSGENLVDIIYVKNAAVAHRKALEALKDNKGLSGNSYFIGQERPVKLWSFIDEILSLSKSPLISDMISFKNAYILGFVFEKIFSFLGINKPEPPMTRFVAMQLAKNHYFSHEKAKQDIGYIPEITIEEGLKETFKQHFPE